MLTQLSIRDFAIVDEVELTLESGMTVLTGETGAGKSILLDALSLALGDRADAGAVRHGAERADICAAFETSGVVAAAQWLGEHDLDTGGECMLRRVINADGRSRAYINGRPATLQSLRELGECLVDIHGQHEHQSLLKDRVQRELLDGFGELGGLAAQTAAAAGAWKTSAARLQALRDAAASRDERLDLLRYQVGELTALAPLAGEFAALEERQARLANAGEIGAGLRAALDELYEQESSIHDRLARLHARLTRLRDYEPGLASLCELLENTRIHASEAVTEARERLAHVEDDPGELAQTEQRLGALHELARKHRVEPDALAAQCERLGAELEDLEHAGARLDECEARVAADLAAYDKSAAQLSEARAAAAHELGAAVSEAMQTLGMPGGRFAATLAQADDPKPRATGRDLVRFEVSANPGQPLRPLGKVASGGELSRISLAIQLIVSRAAHIPTLIFDEVDAGIGGATAEIVGEKLAALGAHYQTLCVTHLAQVAAQAHHHVQVSKMSGASTTRTGVRVLSGEERVNEVARMLGGVDITPQSLAHAESMLGARAGSKRRRRR